MTTEAEAKAIEFTNTDGAVWDVDVALWVDDVCQEARHATEADLLAAGYVPASRLLAVEAELGRLEYEAKFADEKLVIVSRIVRRALGCHQWEKLEDALPYLSAPPMPPVAPEPAQETDSLTVRLLPVPLSDNKGTLKNPEPAQETGGVTARSARHALVSLYEVVGDHGEHFKRLHAFVDQQEQSEREAAGLRVELEEAQTLLAHSELQREALRAENEGLKAKLAWARGGDGCNCAPNHMHDCPAYQQPAEAAPVAKAERRPECPHGVGLCTSSCPSKVAKAEAPSEPLCRCGHAVATHIGLGGSCSWAGCYCVQALKPEPAPQPPATTGARAAEARTRIELEALEPADPAQPQQQGDGVTRAELRSQFIDAFCASEHMWVQGKTHEALGRLCTAVAKLAQSMGVGATEKP